MTDANYSTPQRKIQRSSTSSLSTSSPQITPLLHHSPHLSPIVANRLSSKSTPNPLSLLTTSNTHTRPLPGIAEVSNENEHNSSFSYNHLTMQDASSLSFIESTPIRPFRPEEDLISKTTSDSPTPQPHETMSNLSSAIYRPPLTSYAMEAQLESRSGTPATSRKTQLSEIAGETLNSISLLPDDFLLDEFYGSAGRKENGESNERANRQEYPHSPREGHEFEATEGLMLETRHAPKLNLMPSRWSEAAVSSAVSHQKEASAQRADHQTLIIHTASEERKSNKQLIDFIQQKYGKYQQPINKETVTESSSNFAHWPQRPAMHSTTTLKHSPKPFPPTESLLASRRYHISPVSYNSNLAPQLQHAAERVRANVRNYPPPHSSPSALPAVPNISTMRSVARTFEAVTDHKAVASEATTSSQSNLPIGSFYALILDAQQQPVLVPVRDSTNQSPHHFTSPPLLEDQYNLHPSPAAYRISAPPGSDGLEKGKSPQNESDATPNPRQKKSKLNGSTPHRFPHDPPRQQALRSISPIRARYAKYDTSINQMIDEEDWADPHAHHIQYSEDQEPQDRKARYMSDFEQYSEVFYTASMDFSTKVDRQYWNYNLKHKGAVQYDDSLRRRSLNNRMSLDTVKGSESLTQLSSNIPARARSTSPSNLNSGPYSAGNRKRQLWKRLSVTPTKVSASTFGPHVPPLSLSASASRVTGNNPDYDDRTSEFWKYRLIRRNLSSIISPPRVFKSLNL